MIDIEYAKVEYAGRPLTSPLSTSALILHGRLQMVGYNEEFKFRRDCMTGYQTCYELFTFKQFEDLYFQGETGLALLEQRVEEIRLDEAKRKSVWSGWCAFDQGPPAINKPPWALEISRTPPSDYLETTTGMTGTHNILLLEPLDDVLLLTDQTLLVQFKRVGIASMNAKFGTFDGIEKQKMLIR